MKESKPHGKGATSEEDKKSEEKEPKFDSVKLLQVDVVYMYIHCTRAHMHVVMLSMCTHFPLGVFSFHVSIPVRPDGQTTGRGGEVPDSTPVAGSGPRQHTHNGVRNSLSQASISAHVASTQETARHRL